MGHTLRIKDLENIGKQRLDSLAPKLILQERITVIQQTILHPNNTRQQAIKRHKKCISKLQTHLKIYKA